ncbi:MAG: phage portal protein [Caldilineaceae bacterium]
MIAIDKLTPEQLERFLHMQSIVDRQENDARKVVAFRKYYDGEHPILLTDRQREYIGDLLDTENFTFAHNVVKTIVDTLRERLEVEGFTVNGESADEEEGNKDGLLAGQLWDWWIANRLDSEQIRAYRKALRDGKSYVMVSYDNDEQRPDVGVHSVWDGKSGVTFHRDPGNPKTVLFANRYFYTFDPLNPGKTGTLRKTTYLPHEIRKYVQDGKSPNGWATTMDEGDPVWPLPWVTDDGKPLGVALVEFANPGGSEIEQILGLQNGLNKSWLDLIAAADTSGFAILAFEYNEAGPAVGSDDNLEGSDEFRVGPGRALEVDGGRVHRIEGADLTHLIDTIWALTAAIAGVSRTPQYHLKPLGASDVPSGEALKMLESGLVKRAEERQLIFGQAWEDVMALAYRVGQKFGNVPDSSGKFNVGVQWADANVRNEAVEIGVAEGMKRLEVPDEIVWQRAGLTPEQIAKAKQTARDERIADVAAMAGAIQLQATRNQPQTNPQQGNN